VAKLSLNLKISIVASLLFCLSVNFLSGNNLYYALLNSILLATSIIFSLSATKKVPFILVLSLSLIPLLSYVPTSKTLYLNIFIYILLLSIVIKCTKHKYFFTILGLIVLFLGNVLSNNLVNENLSTNPERFIWNVPETNQAITDYQRSSFYTIYRLRLFIYNKGIYFYSFLTSIAGLFSLRNIYDTILLANIYPLALGIRSAIKNHNTFINKVMLLGIIVMLFGTGISKSPDKFATLFPAVPIFIYLVITGFQNINRMIYYLLFIFSLFLATSPV